MAKKSRKKVIKPTSSKNDYEIVIDLTKNSLIFNTPNVILE